MKSNKKNILQKYKGLLIFDVLFSIINGLLFSYLATSSDEGYGLMIIGINILILETLIVIGYGYVSYTKTHSFLIPHLYFAVVWNILVTLIIFLLTKDMDYYVVVLRLWGIFSLFSCFGVLAAKIVMIFKKRFSSAEAKAVCQKDKYSENSNISKSSEIVYNAEDATPYDYNAD